MTHQQFLSLKVGDRVYIPDRHNAKGELQALSTVVLSIDRIFGKVKVLLGGDRGYSYRYVRVTLGKLPPSGIYVGICDTPSKSYLPLCF